MICEIPDEMILYVLGNGYNELWESGISVNYKKFKDLGSQLIAKKYELKEFLKFLKLLDKAKNNPSLYTLEDFKYQNEFVMKYFYEPFLNWILDYGEENLVALLIKNGADVNTKDYADLTPLHRAVQKGNVAIVNLLLSAGADINVKGAFKGKTPLDYAIQNNDVAMIDSLLEKGAIRRIFVIFIM